METASDQAVLPESDRSAMGGKRARLSSVLALLVLLIGLVCFAFANGSGLVAANASSDDPYKLGAEDIWDAEWHWNPTSIWNIPDEYGSVPAEKVAPDLPPIRITSNAASVAPGGRVEFDIVKEDCGSYAYIFVQVPSELENVSILGYWNDSDTPVLDFARDIGYDSTRYYLPQFSLYRIMSDSVTNFGPWSVNENGEKVRYGGWDFDPTTPHWERVNGKITIKVSGDVPDDFDIDKKLRIRAKLSFSESRVRDDQSLPWKTEWRSELEAQVAAPASSSITVNTPATNTGVKYHGIKIFDANKLETGEATDIRWHAPERYTPQDRARIYEILKLDPIDFTNDETFNADAQRVADALAAMVEEKGKAISEFTEAYSQLIDLLNTIWHDESAFEFPTNTQHPLADGGGYYVFYSELFKNPDAMIPGRAIGSPIFMLIGENEHAVVNEKVPSVSVQKWICDPEDDSVRWKETTAAVGEDIHYKLIGDIPANINDFRFDEGHVFSYAFIDSYDPSKLAIDLSTVKVTNNGADITASASVTAADGVLRVSFDNLLTVPGVDFSKKIEVSYVARLTEDAVVGAAGNPNTVHVEYSASPLTDAKNTTFIDRVSVYTFALDVVKASVLDESDLLSGAVFELVPVRSREDATPVGTALTSTVGGADGVGCFPGVSSGEGSDGRHGGGFVYKLVESVAPEGFLPIEPVFLSVSFDYESRELSYEVTDSSGAAVSFVSVVAPGDDGGHGAVARVSLSVLDVPFYLLPVTGLLGNAWLYVAGALACSAAVVLLVRSRRARGDDSSVVMVSDRK